MRKFFDAIFNFDSPFMLRAYRVAALILLNILWLVCCLPLVTIGPATVAMNHVIFLYHTHASDELFRPFFRAFRRDFFQSILLGIPVTVVSGLLFFNGLYIYGNYPDQFHPLWIPFALMLLITGAVITYGFPMLARYSLTLRQVVNNSLIFFVRNLPGSLAAMSMHLLPVLVWLFLPNQLANFGFFWVLIGGSLVAYINDRKLLAIFEKQQADSQAEA